jgi:hypothetical protein
MKKYTKIEQAYICSKLKEFSLSEMPVTTDEHFWIVKIPKSNPFIWTKIIRYQGDLLLDSLQKKHPDFQHYDNTYKIGSFCFYEAEKIPKGLVLKKAFYSGHSSSAFPSFSLNEKYLKNHLVLVNTPKSNRRISVQKFGG